MADKPETTNIYKKPPVGIGPTGKPYAAIIIDDSQMTRKILKQILLSVQFNVIEEFDNGQLAVTRLKNQQLIPDFLFIDVEMPGLDGVAVVREVKPYLPHCKIFMVTAHSEKEKVAELLALGINGYIVKPFDRDSVVQKILQMKS